MLELHHAPISTCSQKVRLVLAEKGLQYTSQVLDLVAGDQHKPEYAALNPSHVVPTLVHGERVLLESSLINGYFEDAFPETPLSPADPYERFEMARWIKKVDEQVHPWAPVLTFAIGPRF